jgi:hypothetical protein
MVTPKEEEDLNIVLGHLDFDIESQEYSTIK